MCRAAAPRHVRLAVMFALALPAAGLATDRPEQDAVEQASDAAPGAATSAAIQSAGSEPTERVDQQAGSAPRAAGRPQAATATGSGSGGGGGRESKK